MVFLYRPPPGWVNDDTRGNTRKNQPSVLPYNKETGLQWHEWPQGMASL